MKSELKNISRKLSYLLRHNPEDLDMDKQGWVYVMKNVYFIKFY